MYKHIAYTVFHTLATVAICATIAATLAMVAGNASKAKTLTSMRNITVPKSHQVATMTISEYMPIV